MPFDEHLKIQTILLMAKLEYSGLVIRHFQRQNLSVIPYERTIRRIFDKFLETGTVHDRERSVRS